MRYIKLRDLEVSRIGLGAMGMSTAYTGAGADEAESIGTRGHPALELGVTLIDTAEQLHALTLNEELAGGVVTGRRDQVVLWPPGSAWSSHSGDGPGEPGQQPGEHPHCGRGVTEAAGHLLHRPVLPAPRRPEDPDRGDRRRSLAELIVQGKAGTYGLSEAGPDTIRRAHAVHPVHRRPVGVLPVDQGPGGERVLPVLRELCIGLGALLAAGARSADRSDPLHRRVRRRLTSAAAQTRASPAENSSRNLALA